MAQINFTITDEPVIDFTITDTGGGALPYYNGSYNVTPKVSSQTLQTKNKSMKENVLVLPISQTEVHNEKGVTLTIGEV